MKWPRIIITAFISLSTILCMQKHITAAQDIPVVKLIEVQFASTDQVSQLGSMGLDIWEVSHLDYIYLNGVVSGSVTYPSGFSATGDYNVRLFFNDSYTLEASSDFTVE